VFQFFIEAGVRTVVPEDDLILAISNALVPLTGFTGTASAEELRPEAVRIIRLVQRQDDLHTPADDSFRQTIEHVGKAIRALVTTKDGPTEGDEARHELESLRRSACILQALDEALWEMARTADEQVAQPLVELLRQSTKSISARRAYLAWVLNESDDQELGREVALPEPQVESGASHKSFAW
jgi:hypothetical protein